MADVGLVHGNFTRGGGMEAYLMSLVKGFQAQGDRVTVYACNVDPDLVRDMDCAVHQFRSSWPRKMREFRYLAQCNQLPLRERHDFSLTMARTGNANVAVCGGVHAEAIRHIHRTALLRGVYDLFEKHYENKMFLAAPRIMAHSRTVAEQIRRHYPAVQEKIQILYPPLDTSRFGPLEPAERANIRSALGISENRLTVLFVSCGHQRKGLDQLLAAFAGLDPRRYELLVAGSRIGKSRLKNVRYLGYVNDLAPVYNAVDFTILPAHYEPFGLVVPESLQCGTPVILTPNVGAAELVSEQEAVLLADNHPETIRETLRRMERSWKVEPGFAQRHHLEIKQHICAIKECFAC